MKPIDFEPRGSALLVQQEPITQIGSIHLPQEFKGQRARCKVIGCGPDVTRCKVGDYVIVSPSAVTIDASWDDPSLCFIEDDECIIATVTYGGSLLHLEPAGVA